MNEAKNGGKKLERYIEEESKEQKYCGGALIYFSISL
jgi:hypothetical protein